MKKHEFKSVGVSIEENKMTGRSRLVYDVENARSHAVEVGLKDCIAPSAWLAPLFISLMACGFGLALVYGLLYLAGLVTFTRVPLGGPEYAFIAVSAATLITVWLILTARSVAAKAMRETVAEERGQGNWKLIGMEEWERFLAMHKLSRSESILETAERNEE